MIWWRLNWRLLALLFALALGSKLIFFSTHQSFTQDDVRDYLYIQDLIQTRQFYIPLGPQISADDTVALPPLYYYLYLIVSWFGGDYFYAMALTIMVLESLSPLALFYFTQRLLQLKKGLAVGLSVLYTLSPLVVSASISAWNPNLVPLLSLIFYLSSWRLCLDKRAWWSLPAFLSLLGLINLHFQWFVLLPIILVDIYSLFRLKKAALAPALVTLGLSLVLLSPYLHYEVTHDWHNIRAATAFIFGNSTVIATERLRLPVFSAYFFSGFYLRFFTGPLFLPSWTYLYEETNPSLFQLTAQVGAALIFWGVLLGNVGLTYWRWRQKKINLTQLRQQLIPALFFILLAGTLRLYKGDKPDYFLRCFLPFFVIFLGQLLALIPKRLVILLVFGVLISVELVALGRLPGHHDFAAFTTVATTINQVAPEQRTIVPLSQELVLPLTYFFSPAELALTPNSNSRYNFLLCFDNMHCAAYNATETSPNNSFKYDLVNPQDYSLNLTDYDATASGSLTVGNLQLRVIVRQTP